MKILSALAVAAGIAGVAHSNPLVIEESSTLAAPPGIPPLGGNTGLDGNDAVAVAFENIPDPAGSDDTRASAYLFRRNGTTWSLVRKLAETYEHNEFDVDPKYPVAMRDGVLAMVLGSQGYLIFERENGDWVQKPLASGGVSSGPNRCNEGEPEDIEIYGGRIFLGGASWGGSIRERNAAGDWVSGGRLWGDCSGDGDGSSGPQLDISQNWAVVRSPYNDADLPSPAVHVFQRSGTSWPLHTRLVIPEGHDLGDVAIRDSELFTGDLRRYGTVVWRRDTAGQWVMSDALRTAGDFNGLLYNDAANDPIQKDAQYVLVRQWNEDRGARVVNVFQADAGSYRHLAMLVARDGSDLGGRISISGRGVLVGTRYFALPASFTQPSLLQDTFAMGNGAGWSYLPGSQFSVVQSGASRVFRQASTAGDAGAVFDAADWTHQSIQADVKPTAVSGTNRWVGLATRRTDGANYYYVTLRSSGVIELKRNLGGTFTTLDSASAPWALNRTYQLRLESVGTLQRVYLDGALVLEARDGALTQGRTALLSYRAAADYDNVVVSPFATQTIYSAGDGRSSEPQPEPWEYSGPGSWRWEWEEITPETGNDLFRQVSTAGDARAVIGPAGMADTDQIVETRIRPRTFGASGDPWFGVLARFQDTSSYVYLSLRRSNTLTLRKVVNGSIQQLASAPLTVSPDAWYTLRLEAVGSQLRAYLNGALVLEASDSQPSGGRVGLVTFRAAADYDYLRAVTP